MKYRVTGKRYDDETVITILGTFDSADEAAYVAKHQSEENRALVIEVTPVAPSKRSRGPESQASGNGPGTSWRAR